MIVGFNDSSSLAQELSSKPKVNEPEPEAATQVHAESKAATPVHAETKAATQDYAESKGATPKINVLYIGNMTELFLKQFLTQYPTGNMHIYCPEPRIPRWDQLSGKDLNRIYIYSDRKFTKKDADVWATVNNVVFVNTENTSTKWLDAVQPFKTVDFFAAARV